MELNPVDGTRLIILMVAGGVFALAGLWLILRPKSDGHGAKFELFGLKFESSSAGVLVFLIGAAFLALPIFLPTSETDNLGRSQGDAELDENPKQVPGAGSSELGDIPLPRRASGTEEEPNNAIADSMQFAFGETVAGTLSPGDEDWWVFQVPKEDAERFRLTFRNLGEGCPKYSLLNALENQIHAEQICAGSVSKTAQIWNEQDSYYVRVISNGYRTNYEIATSVDR